MIGKSFGGYEVTEKIAEGGMGVIYAAKHTLMGRSAVVKVLLPAMSAQKQIVERFFNEAKAAAQIHHPGIVDVFDLGYTDDGQAFIVMERLRGETLQDRIRRGRIPWQETVMMVRQMSGALAAAHKEGIVHRDLKPDNIFVVPDPDVPGGERIKILDFGIAKIATTQGSMATLAGSVMGTPPYMAPEQCTDSAAVDHRTDIYALGCILYEMLTQKPPFGFGHLDVLAAHMRDPIPALRPLEPSVPDWLEYLGMRMLDKNPVTRLQSCNELAAELSARLPQATTSPRMAQQPPGYAATMAPATGQHTPAPAYTPAPLFGSQPNVGSQPHMVGSQPNVGSQPHMVGSQPNVGSQPQFTPAPYPQPQAGAGSQPALHPATPITTHTAGAGQIAAPSSTGAPTQKKGMGVGVILLVTVLLGAIGGGAFFFLNQKKKANNKTAAHTPSIDAGVTKRGSSTDASTTPNSAESDAGTKIAAGTVDAGTASADAAVVVATASDAGTPGDMAKRIAAAKAKALYISKFVKAATGLIKKGKCKQLGKRLAKIEAKFKGSSAGLKPLVATCKKAAAGLTKKPTKKYITKYDQRRAIDRLGSRITRCADRYGGGFARIKVFVRPNGRVRSARAINASTNSHASCGRSVMRQARFPRTIKGGSYTQYIRFVQL